MNLLKWGVKRLAVNMFNRTENNTYNYGNHFHFHIASEESAARLAKELQSNVKIESNQSPNGESTPLTANDHDIKETV